jgi:hypothetical protein
MIYLIPRGRYCRTGADSGPLSAPGALREITSDIVDIRGPKKERDSSKGAEVEAFAERKHCAG